MTNIEAIIRLTSTNFSNDPSAVEADYTQKELATTILEAIKGKSTIKHVGGVRGADVFELHPMMAMRVWQAIKNQKRPRIQQEGEK